MSNRTYDLLKYFAEIIIPALATLYAVLAGVWCLPYAEEIPTTLMALDTFLGTALMLESKKYHKRLEK